MIGRRSRISVAVGVGLVMVLSAAPGLVQAPGVPTVVVANADTGTMEAIPVPPGASIHFHSNGSREDRALQNPGRARPRRHGPGVSRL